MKKQILSIMALWFCSQALAYAGNQTIVDKQLDDITQHGNLNLEEVTVKNETTVHGVLKAKDSHLNQVTVHGQTKIETSSVRGPLTIHGSAEIEESTLEGSVNISGETEIDECKVSGDVTISGHTEIDESTFTGVVTLSGGAEIDESVFEKDVNLKGHLESSKSTFANLHVRAYDVALDDSTVNGNIIIDKSRRDEPQVLRLNNTHVKGSVEFKSGNGIIEKDDTSNIDGKVIGGRVTLADEAD